MKFEPKDPDFVKSPYTGLTRRHWIEAGEYLLNGIFNNIKHFEDPVVMPRVETEITYPHKNVPPDIKEAERRAEIFEGITRSFFIAAPLIKDNPKLQAGGYSMREYYKSQLLRSCTKGDPVYVGDYDFLQEETNHSDPFRCFQQTVETCALVLGLEETREVIWDTYTKEEQDTIAAFLSSFAGQNTVPQNWRFFNLLDYAFLAKHGYPVEEEVIVEHAQALLHFSVGEGWYRDGHSFDYYSCWAFNVYGPIWCNWYGYEHFPEIAAKFEEQSHKLMKTYADFFDAEGYTNMWGRSNVYRNAATSAFAGNMYLKHPAVDYGRARRICSGSLMQFLGREDFLVKGIPTLGFYRQFSPLVQPYSCAESPLWFGKAFLILNFPEEHPFWSATECNGTWDTLKKGEVKETCLDGPALCFTNHKDNGETILRTGKVVKQAGDDHGMWNYSKIEFNTKYPWESTPQFDGEDCGRVESRQYVLQDVTDQWILKANATFWHGMEDNVLYRRQFFHYNLKDETFWLQAMNLADFPVENGIFRVDKHRLFRRPTLFTLGSYGFPDNRTSVEKLEENGAKAIVLKGYDATGREKQLAMTIYDGWKELCLAHSTGTNPDSEHSIIVYAKTTIDKQYGGAEPYALISQVITKESHKDFTKEEIFPVKEIHYEDKFHCGAYGSITVEMKNGMTRKVNYESMERKLML